MLVFKNTLDREQTEEFVSMCESLGLERNGKTGPRYYFEYRTTRQGVEVTRATAFCEQHAFASLVDTFPRNGKVFA